MLCDMQAIGYVRVSTDRQAEQGVSLEAQEAKIRAMATVQGADLGEVLVDGGESGKSLNRPGLRRLLMLINADEVQTVIVAKLDRLIRSFAPAAIAFRAIARALNKNGRRTRRSTAWRLESVVRAVKLDAARKERRVA